MIKKVKNIFLFTGVEKEEYDRVLPNINRANRTMVVVFSGLATLLIAVMCLLSLVIQSTVQNRVVYSLGFLGALSLFLVSTLYAKKHPWVVTVLVYIAFSIFFLYGIFIGTITNPTQQTVTFMVMLVFMPVLFCDRPLRMVTAIVLYVLLFIVLCFKNKTGGVLSTDVMDAIIYGVLGAASGGIINHIKVRSYVLEYKLQDASRIDQLTNMNNRNSFESDLGRYPSIVKESLFCIYIDVNGLHELNNSKGHLQGDIMLQFIANRMRDYFGDEYTYRIGGDEFVAFVPDTEEEKMVLRIGKMNSEIEREGYHVAIGFNTMKKETLNMDTIIKAAESEMYKSKSQYYKDSNHDRRRRG